MDWYRLCVICHMLAMLLWFGHMFFWSLVVGPITKRFDPPETGHELRRLSLRLGGLGWPALVVLGITGSVLLSYRGATLEQMWSGAFFLTPPGHIFGLKFLLVVCMIVYQLFVGHRPAPRLIYANMLAALLIVALSVLLVRAPALLAFGWNVFP